MGMLILGGGWMMGLLQEVSAGDDYTGLVRRLEGVTWGSYIYGRRGVLVRLGWSDAELKIGEPWL